jgi:hypothetical protein
MRKHVLILGMIAIAILVTLACTLVSATATPDPGLLNTQVALALTQAALNNSNSMPSATTGVQDQTTDMVKTQAAIAMTQTAMSSGPAPTQESAPTQQSAATEQDLESQINSANILVYEDIAEDPTFIPYVKRALESVDGHKKYVADAMGTFMSEMNSGTKWDLIIVAAELRTQISGDYWTVLKSKVDDGAALVSEIWYINKINDGKIAPFLSECGVKLQSDWQAKSVYDRIDYGMYWVDSSNPVFNTPNRVNPFGASLTDPAWLYGDIGDLLEVTDSSKAQILASHELGQDMNYGLITTCMQGRVILQTFSSHNYPTNDMIALWVNYIKYTLTNHFLGSH